MILQEFNEFEISNTENVNGGWFRINFQEIYESALESHSEEMSFINENYSKEATFVKSKLQIVEPKPIDLIPIASNLNEHFQELVLSPLPGF